jgi:hypothetical protein
VVCTQLLSRTAIAENMAHQESAALAGTPKITKRSGCLQPPQSGGFKK